MTAEARKFLEAKTDDQLREIARLCGDTFACVGPETRAAFEWNARTASEILASRA